MPSVPLTDLAPGVVLDIQGHRRAVIASLWLEQDDFVWSEHLLDGGTQWLSVEQDDVFDLTLWTARPDLAGRPQGRFMQLDGRRWTRREKGTANYMAEGPTPYGKAGQCEYADYRSGDQRLSFERYNGSPWEVSVGRALGSAAVVAHREDDVAPQS